MSAFKGELDRVGRDDMVASAIDNDADICANLKKRLGAGIIFTAIGSVILSVNPFKDLHVFDKTNVNKYMHKQALEVPPHLFVLAESAWKAMLTQDQNQAIIISGESGAGKTEAAKGVLEYIAAVSGGGGGDSGIARIKATFIASNPITETFGNAKTVRNNNSSRFGKYFELHFSKTTDRAPTGGRIRVFLLEKTRAYGPGQGERSFHAFYQVFSHAQKAAWRLGNPKDFRILSGGVMVSEGIDDAREFRETTTSMTTCGIQPDPVWQLVAGLLHLGNVTFAEAAKGAQIANPDACAMAAQLLGVPLQSLQSVLLFRSISSASARATQYQKPNSMAESNAARDALLSGIYEKLFLFLVESINVAMVSATDKTVSIAILDIFGFENFANNGFSQLCINFLNESLQKLFVDLTLKAEQAEYAAEAVQWVPIPFQTNDAQMQLIIGKPLSVFKCLDDAVLFGTAGTDESFVKALHKNFPARDCFSCEDPAQGGTGFTIGHYAGPVRYNSIGFIDANRDKFLDEMRDLMSMSTVRYLVDAFSAAPAVMSPRGGGAASSSASSSTSPRSAIAPPRGGGAAGAGARGAATGGKQRPPNVSVQFQKNAAELMAALYAAQPSYIRCIKSNDSRTPLGFDDQRVLQQVQYLGLAEQVRVRRAGYAHRVTYERFCRRYGLCHDSTYPHVQGSPRDATKLLLDTMNVSAASYTFGKTKLFIKNASVLTDVETFRCQRLEGFGQQVGLFKVPKKPIEQGNILLDFVKNLIIPELGQITIARTNPETGADASVTFEAYQALLSAYMGGEVTGEQIQTALVQLLLDVTEQLKLNVVQKQAKKGGFLKSFLRFFTGSKQSTA
jgi:myosin-1